jgi:hypothetical protein
VVRFNATTLWHIDAVEWAPSTASFSTFSLTRPDVRYYPESVRKSGHVVLFDRECAIALQLFLTL